MQRNAFRQLFGTRGPVVLPVIHVLDTAQALTNLDTAMEGGAAGCFLINHDFGVDAFLPIIRDVRAARPEPWIGINFLAVTGKDAFPTLDALAHEGVRVDAYWADDARIDETGADPAEAEEIAAVRYGSGWKGLYFGGTAFKKQRPVAEELCEAAAREAVAYMDVVTTSGVATGHAADAEKIQRFRAGVGDHAIALASGITPENAEHYNDVDCFMVATGINCDGDFYTIDPARLRALLDVASRMGSVAERVEGTEL